ncbi:MAG: CsbD family protein [Dermatophilaceae bacterium]
MGIADKLENMKDNVVGSAKEAVGKVTDNERLEAEGAAQEAETSSRRARRSRTPSADPVGSGAALGPDQPHTTENPGPPGPGFSCVRQCRWWPHTDLVQRLQADFVLGGRYALRERIATGGMGAVWLVEDQRLPRPLALKIMHPHTADELVLAHRFREEAFTGARLSHPNIVGVHDFGEEDGLAYLVMEYVPGRTLADLCAGTAPWIRSPFGHCSPRSPWAWARPTRLGSSTATSSRPTFW